MGPGRSVDNGSRSTRSQRIPGRTEGRRAPHRTATAPLCPVTAQPPRRSTPRTSLWWGPVFVSEGAAVNDGGQRRYGPLGKALVIIPTYNEAENIKPIVARVREAVPEAHVLVADDNSPDGTGKFADEIASEDDHVHVLHRKGKEGLGAAYLAGLLGHRAGVRRPRRDGRGRLAPARGAAAAAHRAQGRGPGPRLPLGARRPDRELAEVPRVHLPGRQPLLPCDARRADPGRHRRLPGLPQGDPGGPGPGGRGLRGVLLPGRPGPSRGRHAASMSSRSRSPSWSARSATPR